MRSPNATTAHSRVAPRTRRARTLATELANANVVTDPQDTRWGVGEDPCVLAEALEAGAHWIASGNFETLKPANMERWLDKVQRQGRFTHVPRPFILDPEDAVTTMMRANPQWHDSDDVDMRMTLAHAICEPNDDRASLDRRVAIIGRFGADLTACGMHTIGDNVDDWSLRASAHIENNREHKVWRDIQRMQQAIGKAQVRRTREAEDRRMQAEAEGGTWTTNQPRSAGKGRR